MAFTFTSNLGLAQPTPLDPSTSDVWGSTLNTDWSLVDAAVAGTLTLDVSGSSNVVLTSINGAPDQSRNANFILTGTLTGNIYVLFPNGKGRVFSVTNNTTGAFTLSIGVNNGSGAPTGTTVAVAQGNSASLASTGSNIATRITAGGLGAVLAANNGTDFADIPQTLDNLGGVPQTRTVSAGPGLTGGGDLSANITIGIDTPMNVTIGGTGNTSLTAHGILLGEGTSPVGVTAAMTNGQLLVGQSSADPLPKTLGGDATLAASGNLTLANTAVTAGTYSYPATVTVDAKGRLTGIAAAPGQPAIVLASGSLSSSTNLLSMNLDSYGSSYGHYTLYLDNLDISGTALNFLMSTNGGSTYLSAYTYSGMVGQPSSLAPFGNSGSSDPAIDLSGGTTVPSGPSPSKASTRIDISSINVSGALCSISWQHSRPNASGGVYYAMGCGGNTSGSNVNAIRISAITTGSSGTYRLVGYL